MIAALMPLLRRYALARPNARSSHAVPTPQGAGAAIIAVPIVILAFGYLTQDQGEWQLLLAAGLAVLALTGGIDDVWPLPVWLRLLVQVLSAYLVVIARPEVVQIFPLLPSWLETAGLVLGLVWFINLTNFMDGIDGITVVQKSCVSLGVVLLLAIVASPAGNYVGPVAIGLLGALVGFIPFNKHVASAFMGDVGSLPIGALTGWMLIVVAADGHIAAALLLPMYYIADATVTLYRRWNRGEKLHEAHRSHFYQLAVQRGFLVPEVTNRILGLNVALGLLAFLSVEASSPVIDITVVVVGLMLTAALMRHFDRGRNA
ncbi:MAG: glycosyltransferase family 4 protein [Hyphomicrobiaceae bacterium TMED74]|nr:glycosyl transferase [Filomicrobium sp.]RPG46507.1 MAG: glycosyltransferase family 4 protein [Hyphomicrobiaceae bacterium TMED74]